MPEQIRFEIVEDMLAVPAGEARLQVELRRAIVDDVLEQNAHQRDAVGENRMVEKDEHAVVRPHGRAVFVVQLPQRPVERKFAGDERGRVRLQVLVVENVARNLAHVIVDGEGGIVDPHRAREVRHDQLRETRE